MSDLSNFSAHELGFDGLLEQLLEQAHQLRTYCPLPPFSPENEQLKKHLQAAIGELGQCKQLLTRQGSHVRSLTVKESGLKQAHFVPIKAEGKRKPEPSPESNPFPLKESPAVLYKTSPTHPYPLCYISENVERIMGYSPEELLGNPTIWPQLLHPQDVPVVEEQFPVLVRQGGGKIEYRFRFGDGSYHWLLEQFQVVYNQEGGVDSVVGCLLDITEQKQAEAQAHALLQETQVFNQQLQIREKELRQSLDQSRALNEKLSRKEQFTNLIIARINEGIVVLDQQLRYQVWNPFMAQRFGFSEEQVLGKRPEEMFSFQEELGMSGLRAKALAGEPQVLGDTFIPTVGPEGIWISATFSPLINPGGEIMGVVSTISDITERKRMEQSLQEQRNLLASFFDSAPFHMVVIELLEDDYRAILPNQHTADFYGIPLSEVRGKTAREMGFPPPIIAEWLQLIKTCIALNKPLYKEYDYPHHNGKQLRHLCCFSPISQHTVSVIGLDISQRIQAEEEKSLLLARTQALNLELELSGRKLAEQNENLKKTNSELDRFVYRASHDLRAPLASVLGLITVSRLEKENQTVYLDLMEKSIQKLDTFISDIINYSRNTRTQVSYQEIDLKTLLQETLEGLTYMEGYESMEKRIHVEQEAPFYSDLFRLKIICSNLLSNAIKYRSSLVGQSYVQVKVHVNSQRAFLEVKDNGQGIAPDQVEKIFEMFYRASESSKGSGLGLYIVKEVVEALKGKIRVHSQLQKGTDFVIEIPNREFK